MANSKNDKKKSFLSIFFTAEVFGMALVLLCVLGLICLVAGNLLFGELGVKVGSFFLGVFGYVSFPVLLLCILFGVKLLVGLKINKPFLRFLKYFSLFLLFGGLLVHSLITQISGSFEEYISLCYNGGLSLSHSTFGGVAFAAIAYPVASLLTSVGAYALYAVMILITALVLMREKIAEQFANSKNRSTERGATKKKKEENEDEETVDEIAVTEDEEDFKPTRKIIFGGGAFEKKNPDEKGSGGVKVLFGGRDFSGRSTSSSETTAPVSPTSSYRAAYDRDIEGKTDFVRKPYSTTARTVYSPMGGRADSDERPDRMKREEKMDIDLSEPDKDVYVFNTRGTSGERIPRFDLRARGEGYSTEGFEKKEPTEESDYNVSRFSSRVSEPIYDEIEDVSEGEPSRFGGRGGAFEGRGVSSDGRSGEDRGRVEPSIGYERGTSDPTDTSRRGRGSEAGDEEESGSGRNPRTEEPLPENPITRAMRESENKTTVTESDGKTDFDSSGYEDESETSSFDDGYSGGSFFAAEDRTRPPKVTLGRDRAHSTSGESRPTSTPSASSPSPSTTAPSTPIRGKQLSMTDIPDENKLINPIDNIPKNYKYVFPPINLLVDYGIDEKAKKKNEEEQLKRAETICQILKNANIDAKIEDIKYGPAITRFELSIPPTVSVKRITEKYEDLNLWLAARDKIRLVAPIQGTSRIGIEVPNASPATVGLKGMVESREFKTAKQSSLSFCLGLDLVGKPVVLDISKMPHLLVGGATGTGKSVFLNTLLISLIYKYTPEELRIILVDPKVVEFSLFRGIPNLMFNEIFIDNARVCSMLEWAVQEMEERYLKLNEVLAKNIEEYNAYMEKKKGKKLPKILIIIDEFADLMNSSSERKLMENKISRLAAKARAAGIHLIMATQRPSADIMEGSIKTNFTSRIAFKMSSPTDAMVIMGEAGADKLLGRGDVLFRTSTMPSSERAQGCFVDTPEIEKICNFIRDNNECYYDEFALEKILNGMQNDDAPAQSIDSSGKDEGGHGKSDEELIKKAMRIAISANNLSISGMQRKLGVGYPKAGKLMDILVERGYVSESVDNKNRKIYMTKEQFEEIFGEPF